MRPTVLLAVAALLFPTWSAAQQDPAFDIAASREHGIEVFPSPNIGLRIKLKERGDEPQQVLEITLLDPRTSRRTAGGMWLVRPGETLYFRSPRSEGEELHVRVVVAPANGESLLDALRVVNSVVVAASRVRTGGTTELTILRPAA